MSYEVSAHAYLSRAKLALVEGSPEHLFYAAFELRCCVEARQGEYVEALAAYEGTKVKPWKLRKEGARIRKQSQAATIALMQMSFPDGTVYDSYHTPVTDALLDFAEQTLGRLLHCQPMYRSPEDPWWEQRRADLYQGYRMAWLACQGDSMVPPLWAKDGKAFHPSRIALNDSNKHLIELFDRFQGQQILLHVDYPDAPPSAWVCDL